MLGGVTLYGLSVVAFAIVGLAHVTSWALVQTVIQNYSPSAFRGRTMAIFHMSDVVVIVGSLLAGTLAALWGALGSSDDGHGGGTAHSYDCYRSAVRSAYPVGIRRPTKSIS